MCSHVYDEVRGVEGGVDLGPCAFSQTYQNIEIVKISKRGGRSNFNFQEDTTRDAATRRKRFVYGVFTFIHVTNKINVCKYVFFVFFYS